ncbi:MAG: CHAT domain-containing protein [Caldilineaceae bacterium]
MPPLPFVTGLAPALQHLLLTLYRNWYGLPLASTRKHLDIYRTYVATLLTDPAANKAERRAALQDFLWLCSTLPIAGELVEVEVDAVRRELEKQSELSAVEADVLSNLLRARDPTQLALAELRYLPSHLPQTVEDVRKVLNLSMSRAPLDEQVAMARIFAELDQQLPTVSNYTARSKLLEDSLLALEKIPLVRLLAWRQLSAGKASAEEVLLQSKNPTRGIFKGPIISEPGSLGFPSTMMEMNLPSAMAAAVVESALDSDESLTAHLFSDIRFASMVKQQEEVALTVRLTPEQQAESGVSLNVDVTFVNPRQPELVDVVVSAPGFSERLESWNRTIKVYAAQNSEPAIFLLKGEKLGKTQIKVDFRHRERLIGTATLACEVATRSNSVPAKLVGDAVEVSQFLSAPPPPADLELRIVLVEKTLQFMLHSANPLVGYHWQKVGETTLRTGDPGRWLSDKLEQLNRLARISRDFGRTPHESKQASKVDPTEIIDGIGTDLWDELVPKELRYEYWGLIKKLREAGVVKSLLITSDEPWIPWEMLKPYRVDEFTQQSESDSFWAEGFTICRWLAGRGPLDEVKVNAASIVAPVLDLPNVQREVKGIRERLTTHHIAVGDEIKTVGQVKEAIKGATVQLLHFATHGSFEGENVERSKIALQDGVLMPDDLSLARTGNLRLAHPLIFLNTCNAGRLGFTPTDLGGWADRLLRNVRAFAVIGAQWEVNDALAADFAQTFYNELLNNKPLGEAFQIARRAIQQKDPLNPTWLAYTLYGDPNSRVVV